ncbi:MAG: (R)-citramalate synthase [Acidimicrobiia bacterium]
MSVEIYDTTLRDGCQGEGISFSVGAKVEITRRLDAMGIHYIEGGWPGSNPRDAEYFKQVRRLSLKSSQLTAFSFVGKVGTPPEQDESLRALLDAETPIVTVVGKSWDLHVEAVLRTTLDENRRLIRDAVRYLVGQGRRVMYDAEQFFDGYKANPVYALKTLEAAAEGGAEIVVLCDTNGGSMPWEVATIVEAVRESVGLPVGMHPHNDCELGVANALAAVRSGAVQVQGTINGYGERVGNANLSSIIPNLKVKMGINCISDDQLRDLTALSHRVSELTNLELSPRAPYVGRSAFAHKAGLHADATMKLRQSYQHIVPDRVGNETRVLISELAGKGNVLFKASEFGLGADLSPEAARRVAQQIKERESEGYAYEKAEASFELLLRRTLHGHAGAFQAIAFEATSLSNRSQATARVKVDGAERSGMGEREHLVDALWAALSDALTGHVPEIARIEIVGCESEPVVDRTGAHVRVRAFVSARSGDGRQWRTVGCGNSADAAVWQALVDCIEFGTMKRVVEHV